VVKFSLVSVLSVMLLWSGQLSANEWGVNSNREDAVVALKDGDPATRRKGLARLAEIGKNDDVPHMLRLLRDDDSAVRGMAHQAIEGLWLRVDNLAARRIFIDSITKIQNGQWKVAIELLDQVIDLEPTFSEAWNKRGDAWLSLGELDRALVDYENALKLNPYHYGVMQSCASIYMERSDARNSYAMLTRAMAINPNLEHLIPTIIDLEKRLDNDQI